MTGGVDGLIGHETPTAAFLDALRSDRVHHAWLLAGTEGIGKARFARAAAVHLLARAAGPAIPGHLLDVPASHPVAALMAAGSHPDYRELVRLPRDRTDELARSVTVEQVRGLQSLFATTPSLSPRRVVVIDAIDDLERSAANALLKSLEEPPAGAIFLLVSHAPGRLLPTIRSRCRLLRFTRLTDAETAAVLRRSLPHEDDTDVAALTRIAAGAPGAAGHFAGLDIAALDLVIERLVTEGDPTTQVRTTLARALAGKPAQARYAAFLERAPARIAAVARTQSPAMLDRTVALWREARDIADRAIRQSDDPQVTTFEMAGLLARLAPAHAPAKA